MGSEDLLGHDIDDEEESVPGLTCMQRFKKQVVQLFDLNLFTNPRFLILLAVGITNQLAYFIPFVYLVDYSVKKGMGVDQAVVLSVILGKQSRWNLSVSTKACSVVCFSLVSVY